MRLLLAAAIAAITTTAIAQDQPILTDETIAAVTVLATKGYADPSAAEVRNIHLSFARNGHGYCGEVTVEGGETFVPFHAILADESTAASILRLTAPAGEAKSGSQDETVERMFINFGCIEAAE